MGCRKPARKRVQAVSHVQQEGAKKVEEEPKKPQKSIKQMALEEALEAARYYEFIAHEALLIATYQHIIAKSKDSDVTAQYLIKLADHYLQTNNFTEAKKYYKKIAMLYPGYRDIERARYREVIAHFSSSLAPSRDQAATQETISLAKKYMADFPQGSIDQVMSIVSAAYKKLLASELLVVEFYLNKFALSGAPEPLRGGLQRLQSLQDIIIPALKKYDATLVGTLESASWKEHMERPWSKLDDLLETAEGREQVVVYLQAAVALMRTIVVGAEPVSSSSGVAVARDKF